MLIYNCSLDQCIAFILVMTLLLYVFTKNLQVTVSYMNECREGKYTKSKETPIEIQASQADSYEQFVKRAVEKFDLKALRGKEKVYLK